MKFNSDIDIDFGDRNKVLDIIKHVPATQSLNPDIKRHPTGIYVTEIPVNPYTGLSNIDYIEAEQRGYVKLDLLNVWVYKYVKDENHLIELMKEPDWSLLGNKEFVTKLIHIGNHYEAICAMPEPIDSIPRLAMFLSLIRPGKKHLRGLRWSEIAKHIWITDKDSGYFFKKSHSCAYAHLVVVNMNLLSECYKKNGTYDLEHLD